jgi:putative SOS response-associated peptidase YedK
MARYSELADIAARFGARGRVPELRPSWDLRADSPTPVIRRGTHGRRELAILSWGLRLHHPLLEGDEDSGTSVSSLNIGRAALLEPLFVTNRCIVPIDAFYAGPSPWTKVGHVWAFALLNVGVMGVAGLWRADRTGRDRFAIITTGPNESVALVEHSMPAILFPEDERAWLNPHTAPYAAHNLIMPHPADAMRAWPVATVRRDGPEMLHRVA